MPISVSRGEVWELLDDKAMPFEAWINSGTPEANFIKTLFLTTDSIALDSPMFQNRILPMLLELGVIDQKVIDRINSRITGADAGDGVTPVDDGMKHYRVPIPKDVTKPLEWISQYCDCDHYIRIVGNYLYLDTSGGCSAPGTEEVIE